MKFLIIFLFFPLYSSGQISFEGKIINTKSKAVVPFATIGLIKENIGVNANEDGIFSLLSNDTKQNDTLIISCIGYRTKKIPVDLKNVNNLVIELTQQEIIHNEVVVTGKNNRKSITLNDFSKCGNTFITTNGYQTQLAQHFKVDEENSILTSIKICRRSSIVDQEKTIFRIRVYDIDTITKSPSSDLCDQIIEVKTKKKIINVNVEKYKILIPNREFFIAIEWLKIPYNENKVTRKVNDKEVEYITYRPSIGWTENVSPDLKVWMLDYNNNWKPMLITSNTSSVAIAATLKY